MNVLFITATRVGDAVLSAGLLDHIVKVHPCARITIACGPAAAGVFETFPNLERLIILDKMLFSLHWARMWFLCVPRVWDLVIDLRNAPVSYFLLSLRQKHLGRIKSGKHKVLDLAGVLGLEEAPPKPKMWPSKENRALAARLIPHQLPILAVGPTANWVAKTWEPSKFIELIRRIRAKNGLLPGCMVALFGRDDERPKALQIINSIPKNRRLDFVGHLSLIEISACLERCQLYIGNDSGLMHIAAASGIPTLGLFGPSKEELYAPWGAHCSTIRTLESFDKIHPYKFDHREEKSLMGSLTVDAVEREARSLLKSTRGVLI